MTRLGCYTPRPAAPLGPLTPLLGPSLAARLQDAVTAHRCAGTTETLSTHWASTVRIEACIMLRVTRGDALHAKARACKA